MNYVNNGRWNESVEKVIPIAKDFEQAAEELCGKALKDAKSQLHPLLQNAELSYLDRRREFIQAFKLALERRIARKLIEWHPDIEAVFRFNESGMENCNPWDGSIHLLVEVPRLSKTMKALSKELDRSLVKRLQQLGWSRSQKRQSVLEIQQVTPNEIRRGISYGAMFCAVYNVPVKVWPQNGWCEGNSRMTS